MAKRRIYMGRLDTVAAQPLHAPTGLVVDAFLAGTLLKSTDAGYATTDLAAASTEQRFLIAQEVPSNEGGDITTPHTIGDSLEPLDLVSGQFANVRVAASSDITRKGVALSSNGDGTLKIAATDGSESVIAYSDEIINTGASVALVQVRVA